MDPKHFGPVICGLAVMAPTSMYFLDKLGIPFGIAFAAITVASYAIMSKFFK